MKGFRYWLADLISGGELTFQTNGWMRSRSLHQDTKSLAFDALDGSVARQGRLDRIAALETPKANATVRKMAKIARGDA